MAMHNPPHPGEFIREIYLLPNELSVRGLAESLGVAPSTLNRIISGKSGISPEMALRLSKALGRSPESWLAMQHNYDLWNVRRTTDLSSVLGLESKGLIARVPGKPRSIKLLVGRAELPDLE